MAIAFPCSVRRCSEISGIAPAADVTTYNIQDALFFNGTPLSFIPECPPGFYCPPGTLPNLITYPVGHFTIPEPHIVPGQPVVMALMGCQSLVSITLPAGSSQAAIQAAANSIILQVAAQQAQCDVIPPPDGGGGGGGGRPNPAPPDPVEFEDLPAELCINTDIASLPLSPERVYNINFYNGTLPTGVDLIRHGTVLNFTGVPTAFGVNVVTIYAVTTGLFGQKTYTFKVVGISTSSPLATGTIGVAYSTTLATGGSPAGPITWAVTSGSLPSGLSLNGSTGQISGTPTTEQTASFTVTMTGANVECSKSFTLQITATPSVGPDWSLLLWGVPNVVTIAAGTASFFPVSAFGDSFDVKTSAPDGGNVDFGLADNSADPAVVDYNGPLANCNIHVILTKGLSTAAVCGQLIVVSSLSGLLLNVDLGGTPDGTLPTGTYDIPFTIPDTLGNPSQVFVVVVSQSICGGFPDDTPSLRVEGTITNV